MKKNIVCLVIFLSFVCVAVFANANEDHDDFGDEIIILEKGRMPAVTFPHRMHQDKLDNECNACHDLFPMKKGIIKKMITEEKLRKQHVMNSKCLKCHKDRKKEGLEAGPTRCTACHVRSK